MWRFIILLLGIVFHTHSSRRSGKSRRHRKFYRDGLMADELGALELEERYERRPKK
jgi:hypothetical protein